MALELHYCIQGDVSTANNTSIGDAVKLSNKAGLSTVNGAQSTASRRPVHKAPDTNAKLDPSAGSLSFDGSDGLDLSAEVNLGGSPYTLVFAWVDGDYTSDSWLFTASSNSAHYGIDAGGAGVLLKPNSSRSPGGDEDSIVTSSTDNSTVSYTFGSDVEALIIVNEGNDDVNFYNIDGALIATKSEALYDSSFPLAYIGHNGAGSKGLNGSVLDVQVHSNVAATAGQAKAIGQYIKNLKD
tara:strand:- start:846 stop:1565 length:720 start_codon:yes stop_codon:yes gene_type:complete